MEQHQAWWHSPAPTIDPEIIAAAEAHQNQLTKPQGSLGRLETIAIQLAGIQCTTQPQVDKVAISIFAGDHGIVAEGVSAFPQEVTGEMIKNFVAGGAAISVLSRSLHARLSVVNVGSIAATEAIPNVVNKVVAPGTANFLQQPAMTLAQLDDALLVGKEALEEWQSQGINLWLGGEMGIGNTTAATAIISQLLQLDPEQIAGPGTGLTSAAVQHKANIIRQALAKHHHHMTSPLQVLQHVGGFEIAALTGAYMRAAQLKIPAIVDGFICGAAALVAIQLNPSIKPYLFFSHRSAEPGHQKLLSALAMDPIVDLNLRLGEGSGAAISVPIIQMAAQLHNQMATFATAGVSEKCDPLES